MKASIYEYRDYKPFVVDLIEDSSNGGRGQRKALAKAIGCQVSHVTNVLSGPGHFSAEQAEAAARHFGLTPSETEFFLLLVQLVRAGTPTLKEFYKKLVQDKQEKYSALKNRLKMPDSLRHEQEATYYSSWHYGAVHVLLSIPEFQTREAIAKKLGLALARADDILAFLVGTGLCRKNGARFEIARPLLHLDRSSPLITKHHSNWRMKTIATFDRPLEDSLHFSSVFSLSLEDYSRVRELLTKALSDSFKVIKESPEKELGVISLDCYRM